MMKWFAYSPDGGMSLHDTPEEAKAWAQREIDDCRDAMDDLGWDEELVSGICWGEVKEKAKEDVNPDGYGSNYELGEI
ncbi:hypothetical protein [Aeromonas phage 85AhydR10PP]|nr:hypothetical protein [Aeromonas phage 85AhydR10PP]